MPLARRDRCCGRSGRSSSRSPVRSARRWSASRSSRRCSRGTTRPRSSGTAQGAHQALVTWLPGFAFGLQSDRISLIWTLIITGVGFLIHVYSIGYMAGERAFARFFAYLNFFVFAMLTLVLSDNFVGLLVGWGLVGLASYLLIGFWFDRPTAVAASRKAFVINVVGDIGILYAVFVIVSKIGSIGYGDVFANVGEVLAARTFRRVSRSVHRLRREVGAGAAAYLAARRDGRPDARLGADPRRDDGHRRRLFDRALRAAVERIARCARRWSGRSAR